MRRKESLDTHYTNFTGCYRIPFKFVPFAGETPDPHPTRKRRGGRL